MIFISVQCKSDDENAKMFSDFTEFGTDSANVLGNVAKETLLQLMSKVSSVSADIFFKIGIIPIEMTRKWLNGSFETNWISFRINNNSKEMDEPALTEYHCKNFTNFILICFLSTKNVNILTYQSFSEFRMDWVVFFFVLSGIQVN